MSDTPIYDEVADEFWPRYMAWLSSDTDLAAQRFREQLRTIRRDPGQSWGPAAVCTTCGGSLRGHP